MKQFNLNKKSNNIIIILMSHMIQIMVVTHNRSIKVYDMLMVYMTQVYDMSMLYMPEYMIYQWYA